MNTGPIIGGTRDGEQHSFNARFCNMPARLPVSSVYDPRKNVPETVFNNKEQLRWVPFHFTYPAHSTGAGVYGERDVITGFWVSLTHENRTLYDDAEYRLFVLMKLSERYTENTKAIEKRLIKRHVMGI